MGNSYTHLATCEPSEISTTSGLTYSKSTKATNSFASFNQISTHKMYIIVFFDELNKLIINFKTNELKEWLSIFYPLISFFLQIFHRDNFPQKGQKNCFFIYLFYKEEGISGTYSFFEIWISTENLWALDHTTLILIRKILYFRCTFNKSCCCCHFQEIDINFIRQNATNYFKIHLALTKMIIAFFGRKFV